ncbi:methylase involved in ubiquinone/menaquinone biosynthesis [Rivularia sp. PCC 7116]|uniref:class I SAM-dependent methyltransferase n=1 Tax=Rivularia sp. PCC 7116 TaxID=373994 RepID=UPI00029F32D7|nr:class I SAM-dependent methyltransferase [Rivularia sp. PCC 7116]AFY54185.1 methylase involved in ubiquinone/menaquinone biosynthesis [Rivularia sp. PCC 7116]
MIYNHNIIQRQYDEIIAPNFDIDAKGIYASTYQKGIIQLQNTNLLQSKTPLQVLDIGIGTGSFLEQIALLCEGEVSPFGVDISEKMLEIAKNKIPNLRTIVDDATNLEKHYANRSFDLICSHFITGYVPMRELAPKIWNLLDEGGYWSLIGQTMTSYPNLRKLEDSLASKLIYWVSGNSKLDYDIVSSPEGHSEVIEMLEENDFEVCQIETFEPKIDFANLDDFLDFGYYNGWLTPFIEQLGIHKASKMLSLMINILLFPIHDNQSIEIALAKKIKK